MVHATPGGWSKRGAGKKGKPCSPEWVVGPRTVQVRRVAGKDASILQALDILVSPSSCDTYPFMLFPPSPWADQKCAIYCEPLSQDPGGRRDHGVNVKMPPHSQASFVGKDERGISGDIHEPCLAQWLAQRHGLICLGMSRKDRDRRRVIERNLPCAQDSSLSLK